MARASFRVLIQFLLPGLIGLSLLPLLPFQLQPTRSLPGLSLQFSWANASENLIEQEITSQLEGALATLRDLQHMNSTTVQGSGRIELEFDEETDMDMRRFETSTIVRQLYPSFPKAVTYPQLQLSRPEASQNTTLLSYTLNGNATPQYLKEYAENQIRLALARIPGIQSVEIYGATPFAWELSYDPEQLASLEITPSDISEVIQRGGQQSSLGRLGESNISWIQVNGIGRPCPCSSTRPEYFI